MNDVRLTFIPEGRFLTLTDDENMTPLAIKSGTIMHEHGVVNLPELKELPRDSVIIDAGAFLGETAIGFARYSDHVMAFEPQLDAWICCEWNCRPFPEITVFNAALGDGSTVYCAQNPLNGNAATRGVMLGGDQKSMRIDDLGLDRLDFLKIDVEGFEPLVIRGAMNTLSKFKPAILCEIYDPMLARYDFTRVDIIGPLKNLGYNYRVALGSESHERCDMLFLQ